MLKTLTLVICGTLCLCSLPARSAEAASTDDVLDNPPSYGNYEDDRNLLHIAVWSALTEQQRGRFEHLSQTAQIVLRRRIGAKPILN
jgi:hypothetical protein